MDTKFVKVKKETDYTVVDNTFIKDNRLSWKAKGVMTYLLSLPSDWVIHLTEIETHATDGKDSLRSAITELKKYGYLISEQKKDESGRFCETIYTVLEKPYTEKPQAVKPKTEKPPLLNTNNNKVLNIQNTDKTTCVAQKDNGYQEVTKVYFDNFKKLYDSGRVKTEKPFFSARSGKAIKDVLSKLPKENVVTVLNNAMNDNWIVEQGYTLTTILSESQINKLLNARPQQKPQFKNFDKQSLADKDFFSQQ